ncbi:hypothetical protein SAMD00019534_056330 [Acytostelium subglobosum LB1]|uniref:hypothetical protein n=1 Tax=Acytostelium subglobosum LB1 TaxID=1410327 RepID=UPI000644975B|nr:hypothetical protein SAMD00019534_056330 [Acytostelium subglobosum LB1]GAM22458.1 hypothetical protein SAMD00019534_056330 [Acytostelium subglobosum LB1]|eukprot:XP_012754578.1 hypothetical protein SAMD00019534_056330 [Acytostelium subglobosum LB1]
MSNNNNIVDDIATDQDDHGRLDSNSNSNNMNNSLAQSSTTSSSYSNNNNNSSRTTTTTINDNVKVCVRTRHLIGNNELAKTRCLTALQSQNTIMLDAKPDAKLFSFDYVADENTTQEQLFDAVARPIVDSCIDGYHGCIFAYGQTGSGKSYTIMGEPHDRGLIPRTFQHIFERLDGNQDPNTTYRCTLSFLEIYNEQIMDLFVETSPNLSIREDLKRGIYVEGLTEIEVTHTLAAMDLLEIGVANRHVAETAMNSNSSRSHSVLTINIESTTINPDDGLTKIKNARLSLIDLAGSERQKSTEAAGTRLKEAGSINKSLSCLGNVIRSLVDVANGKPRHVQYRDSKLTFLLKDSLGGNSKTYIIATVSPSELYYSESLSTLQFAQRAKSVRNMAIINEEASGNITLLQMEIRKLKDELYRCHTSGQFGTLPPISADAQWMSQLVPADPRTQPYEARIHELEVLLSRSLEREEALSEQQRKTEHARRQQKLLCEKKDHFLQSTRFVLKLRESHIARLEGRTGVLYSSLEEEQHEEIQELRKQVRLHPEITRYAIENLELRDILNSYEMSFREGKDSYEDQIISLKQQNRELVSEAKQLLNDKLARSLETAASAGQRTDEYQSPYKSKDTPSTPAQVERRRYNNERAGQQQWEQEKKEMDAQYQELHARFLQTQADLESTMTRMSDENARLQQVRADHAREIEAIRRSNDNMVEMMKKAHALKLEQYTTMKVKEDLLLRDLTEGLIKLEQENNELKEAKVKLLSELCEKNEEINNVRLSLDSAQLSSQRMTEVFIGTPLRSEERYSAGQDDPEDSEPIKFNVHVEQHELEVANRDKMNNLESKIHGMELEIQSLRKQLEDNDQLLEAYDRENNALQEANEMMSNQIEAAASIQVTSSQSSPSASDEHDTFDKKVKPLLAMKDDEINRLQSELIAKDTHSKQLGDTIKNQMTTLTDMDACYKEQIMELSSQVEINVKQLNEKEEQLINAERHFDTTLLEAKGRMNDEFERKYAKLSQSLKEEYNRNIKALNGEILALQARLISPQSPEHQQLQDKYRELQKEYDVVVDSIDDYQERIAAQIMEITKLNNKLKRFNGPEYVDESEIIIISSDDEDYVPPPPPPEPELDISKIVIKKNPNEPEEEEDEINLDNLNLTDISTTSATTSTTQNNMSMSELNSDVTGARSNKAISNNLSIISQIAELERSFHSTKIHNNSNSSVDGNDSIQ